MTNNGTTSTVQGTKPISVPWYGATLSTTTEKDVDQQQQHEYFLQYDLSDSLRTAVPPVVLLLGTFGNVMIMLVMRAARTQFGDPSMPVLFLGLALCDQVVLALGLGRQWVRTVFWYDIRNQHALVCKLHKFLLHAVSRMSTWILVAVTSQRVMTVMWPLRHRLTSTRKRATAVVLVIVGVCCLMDVGILVMYVPLTKNGGPPKCQPVKDSPQAAMYEDKVYPWLNNVTGSWLPFVILVVNNVILGVKVRQSATASRHITDSQQADARSKQATSLSITLIVTSLSFILLTSSIPATFVVKKIYVPSPLSNDGKREADLMLANGMLDLLWYCNSAVNFYLYFLTGPTFRQEARRLVCSGHPCLPCRQCCTGIEAIKTGTTSALPAKDSSRCEPQ